MSNPRAMNPERIPTGGIEKVARAIKWMVRILVPLVAIAVAAGVLGGTAALIAAAVLDHWLRWVCLLLGILAVGAAIVLVIRYIRTYRATDDPQVLADEFIQLTRIGEIADHIIINAQDAINREGGIRPWQRARALWRVLQSASVVEEHVDSRKHARYVLPPRLPQSWAFILASFWIGLIAALATGIISIIIALVQ